MLREEKTTQSEEYLLVQSATVTLSAKEYGDLVIAKHEEQRVKAAIENLLANYSWLDIADFTKILNFICFGGRETV